MADHKIRLRVADIIILMLSKFEIERLSEEEKRLQVVERYNNFLYSGRKKPDIVIKINIVDKLPEVENGKDVFVTYHFQDGRENWRLIKKGNIYIYNSPLEGKKQLMLVNKIFNKVTAYLLFKKDKGKVWNYTDIIYDFLQVLLINYFALRKKGIFVHAVGVRDLTGDGLLFAGKSGAGKSTTAKLWYKHSKAMILNDDRIIVRKLKERFFIYGTPWHGEFSDYLTSRIESAPLKRLFFIHHSPKNKMQKITQIEAFNLLYPALFPTFWDKRCLENIVFFCQDLIREVSSYSLGFVNDKKVINFVRK